MILPNDPAPASKSALIVDPNLCRALEQALSLSSNELTPERLKTLRNLDARDMGISNISGIEYCSNLEGLSLEDNNISDIFVLSSLQKLEILSLNDNPVSDVSPIKKLKELRLLFLGKTAVADLSFVEALPKLQVISVVYSKVTTLVDLYFCYVIRQDSKRLEEVYAFGNALEPGSLAFAEALRRLDVKVQI
jgi:Leucine-rich repeat (LRR) protein